MTTPSLPTATCVERSRTRSESTMAAARRRKTSGISAIACWREGRWGGSVDEGRRSGELKEEGYGGKVQGSVGRKREEENGIGEEWSRGGYVGWLKNNGDRVEEEKRRRRREDVTC